MNRPCSRMRLIGPLLAMSLATCAPGNSSSVPHVCPAAPDYTQAQWNRAADELDRLGSGSQLSQMMADYEMLRRQAIDCMTR